MVLVLLAKFTSRSTPGRSRTSPAIDVFMCGACSPYHSLPVLKDVFAPTTITLSEQRRGVDS